MELRYLRYFVAVAERQSFSRAAEELHVAQSAISEQIKILEEELGVLLLKRTRRKVELTAPGELFLADARAVLSQAEGARNRAQRAARGEIGRLRIGCFSSAVAEFLPGLLRGYREERPGVEVEVRELSPAEQLEALRAREIDVGFTRRIPDQQARGLVQERVYADRVYMVLAENHPLAGRRELPLRAVSNEPFILFERQGAPDLLDQIRLWCRKAGFTPRVVSEAPMMRTILMYVAAGMGLSLVPGCIRCYRQKGVKFIPVKPRPPELELMLVRPKGEIPPAVQAWVEKVHQAVPEIRRLMEHHSDPPTSHAPESCARV